MSERNPPFHIYINDLMTWFNINYLWVVTHIIFRMKEKIEIWLYAVKLY